MESQRARNLEGTELGCSPWRDGAGDSYMKLIFRASVYGKSIIRAPRCKPTGYFNLRLASTIVQQWIAGSAPVLKVLGTSDATTAVNNLASGGVKAGLSTMSYGRPEKVHRDLHESHMLSKLKALRYSQIHRTDFICASPPLPQKGSYTRYMFRGHCE